MATKKSAGYQIDFTTKTLTITKEFSDNAQAPASKEFGILMRPTLPPESMFPRARAKPLTVISSKT